MSREWFANFGGHSPHPEYDRELFLRLPLSRREEILEVNRLAKEIPGIRTLRILNPATLEPYPGQVIFDDFIKPKTATVAKPVVLRVPDVPLWFLTSHHNRPATVEIGPILLALSKIDIQTTKEHCISQGHLSGSKPLEGVTAYLWRLALVKTGKAASLPVSAFLDLEDGIEQLTSIRINSRSYPSILKLLDGLADKLAS